MEKRLTVTLHEDVYTAISKIALEEDRTINYIINSLVLKAIKEKSRKKYAKKVYNKNNATN